MHEWSLIEALVERVEEEAHKAGASTVETIHLKIGALAGVERELLATAFDTFKQGVCARARLEILPALGDQILLERIEMEVP
jgi:hydrogenase nickel incorporation protein HypA/HybF